MAVKKAYVTVHNNEAKIFVNWSLCKKYIDEVNCKIYKGFETMEEAEANVTKMMIQKIYIVIDEKDNVFQFDSWVECKEYIQQYKGCKFKACSSNEEVTDFIKGNIKKRIIENIPDVIYAHTFSSPHIGTGFKLIRNGEEIGVYKYPYDKEQGEREAVVKAVETVLSFETEKRIIIVYAFMGVQMWSNGSWKPKTKEVQEYVNWITKAKNEILIDFISKNSLIQDNTF